MTDEKNITFGVMRAVTRSTLPAELRHFILTLALLADSKTGSAYYGQASIAKAMGVSERQVRRHFKQLEKLTDSPVRVNRRRRGSPDGKGRSSDEWTLALVDPTGHPRPPETTSTGHERPVTPEPQPDICDSSTGQTRQLNRTPTSGDLPSNRRSDRPSKKYHSLTLAAFDDWRSSLWAKLHKKEPEKLSKRLAKLSSRLHEGYTLEQLHTIWTKVADSEFHMKGGYIEPATIVRDSAAADRWLASEAMPGKGVPKQNGTVDGVDPAQWGIQAGKELVMQLPPGCKVGAADL